jgi:F-type H+-transporting ATPase subunit delta
MNSQTDQSAAAHPDIPRHTVLDVASQGIARVYAEALLGAAAKQNQVPEVLEELASLQEDVFPATPQLEVFLRSGAISRRPKAELIQRIFGARASQLFVNFLLVLNDHDRLDLLRGINQEAHALQDKREGRIKVLVKSAVPLPEDQRSRLEQELRRTLNQEPILETQVDPQLLGGLVIRVGDWLYDASVRRRLEDIRNQLIESSSYEIQSRRDHFSSES